MKINIVLTIAALAFMAGVYAQAPGDKPALVVESMYLQPKRGMEDKMEAAIKAHDLKFHPDGPNVAALHKVEYGEKAGWYLWVLGPTVYAAIDHRPAKDGGHDADWSTNVEPLIEQYGPTSLWDYNDELSTGMDNFRKSSHYEVWGVKLKPGSYYRFKALTEKLKKAYESIGTTSMLVFNNPVHDPNMADVSLLWNFSSYDQWSKDDSTRPAYEKLFGQGSWQSMITEWTDITKDYSSELRSILK
ncbi:MAG: hypothetical protein WCO44_13050 [Bacteroidota bacterium]